MDPKNFLENYEAETDKSTAWSFYVQREIKLVLHLDADKNGLPQVSAKISNLISFLIYVDMNTTFVNFIMCFNFFDAAIFYLDFQKALMTKIITSKFAREAWLEEWA